MDIIIDVVVQMVAFVEETKQKISIANKGENNPFYGKQHTEETKKKMSEERKGRELTEINFTKRKKRLFIESKSKMV